MHIYQEDDYQIIIRSFVNTNTDTSSLRPMLQNFFQRNYIAIGINSVKTVGKYAASGVNYAKKVL
jgi:hypothetical protein